MDDPEIIEEVDVYLSKTLNDKLVLLQYPSRPTDRPCPGNILCAKIKPKQQKIELQLGLDTHSRNYDHSKAEQIALNTDGQNAQHGSGNTYFNSSKMDKLVMSSTKTKLSGCYVVARFFEGRLHLTPLNSTLQIRPSFDYLDKGYALGQAEGNPEEEKEEAEAVTVKFAGPNAEKAKKARERSFSYLQEKSEAEPWLVANYNEIGSEYSKQELEKLLCTQMQNESTNNFTTVKNHLENLVPKELMQVDNGQTDVAQTSLTEKLRSIMLRAQVLRFDQIMDFLCNEQALNVEKILQQITILVQGCWVLKSDILFQKESTSPFSGISAEFLIRCRDYILWYFTKNKYLVQSDILNVIKIPSEDVTAILKQIAKKVYNKGWEFKFTPDKEFIDNHPNIVQRQDMLWDVRYKQLVRDLRLGQIGTAEASPKRTFPPPPSPKERRHFKYRESVSDDTEESGTESSSSEKMDVEYSKKGRPLKRSSSGSYPKKRSALSPIKNGPRSRHFSASAFDMPSSFLSALPSIEIKSEFLQHVKSTLYERFCMTLDELKGTLSEVSLGCIVQRDDCDNLLEEVLREIGAQKLKNKWPQNTQPAVLYAFTKFGSPLDRYRDSLLDLFTSTARSRPNFLIKKIEDENGEIVSENVCKQIFEEYCLYKSGYYYLKGTITADT